MRHKTLFMAGFVVLLLAIASLAFEPTTKPTPGAGHSNPATRPADAAEDEVFESVFRYQFEHNESAQKQTAAVYYLSLSVRSNKDPGDGFMKRFAGNKPPVRKLSERKLPGANPGLIFDIESVKWTSNKAEVVGSYYEGPLSAAGGLYTVEKTDGKWKVVRYKMHWIA